MRGPRALRGQPGLRFAKVMGSGAGGGFGLRPSGTHQGLICLFDHREQAQAFLVGPWADGYRQRARRWWSGVLDIASARGSWDGLAWAPASPAAQESPDPRIAVLTRASIRPRKALAFWRHAPPAEAALAAAPGCELAIGLGEAPVLRQCTFSVWRDLPAMTAYAHSGAHGHAAQAAWRDGAFSESMFVRLRLLASAGDWPVPAQAHGR